MKTKEGHTIRRPKDIGALLRTPFWVMYSGLRDAAMESAMRPQPRATMAQQPTTAITANISLFCPRARIPAKVICSQPSLSQSSLTRDLTTPKPRRSRPPLALARSTQQMPTSILTEVLDLRRPTLAQPPKVLRALTASELRVFLGLGVKVTALSLLH